MSPPDRTQLVEGVASSRHPLYSTWCSMKARCSNPNHKHWKYYGGKGVSVCEKWNESFKDFVEDMGPRPEGHTLDRKDGSLGYSPNNCRWADKRTQQRNTKLRADNRLQERNIHFCEKRQRYHVQMRVCGEPVSKRFKTLEEAVEFRDFVLQVM